MSYKKNARNPCLLDTTGVELGHTLRHTFTVIILSMILLQGASDNLERTGPLKSAVGEGYYVVADTSASTSTTGSLARLVSPVIEHTGESISHVTQAHGGQL